MTRSQVMLQEKNEPSSSEIPALPSQKPKFVHIPETKDETMPVYFPPGLPEICLNYLAGDINPTTDKKTAKCYMNEQPFTLFGRQFADLMHPEATRVSNLILRGEKKEVGEALTLIKNNPDLLRCHTLATDPLGRRIKGTPLQIAAMAGDVDLKEGIENEKNRGIVERLIAVSNLSKEEIAKQLQCILSDEAQRINQQRNQQILDAIKRFGKALMEIQTEDMNHEEYQVECKPLIDQFEKDLRQPDSNDVITMGYVFDPRILQETMQWFDENLDEEDEENEHLGEENMHNSKGFGDYCSNKTTTFWVSGIGKLQSKLSSRDAQVIKAGIGNVIYNERLPPRILNNSDGGSYFFNSSSCLGLKFYLGYFGHKVWLGGPLAGGPAVTPFYDNLKTLCDAKTRALQKVCNSQVNESIYQIEGTSLDLM